MSFISENATAKVYAPGYFLAHEDCVRLTHKVAANSAAAVSENGGKYVPMGTVYPTNDKNAIGILYEDVDVSDGDMPGSVVEKGVVYEDKLPAELDTDAKTALQAKGFVFVTSPEVTRP